MVRNKVRITGALVLLLIIIAAIGGFYFFNQQTGLITTCTGGSTFQISSANIIDASQSPTGKDMVRVIATANQGGECARVQLRPDDLNNFLIQQGAKATQEFDMDVVLQKQTKIFQFVSDGRNYDRISERQYSVLKYPLCTVNNCQSENPMSFSSELANFECNCFLTELYANSGGLNSITDTTSQVLINAGSYGSATINTGDQVSSAAIGSKILIKWNGDLASGTNLETPKYAGYFRNNIWTLVDLNSYSSINTKLTDTKNKMNALSSNFADQTSLEKAYNDFLVANLIDKKAKYIQDNSNVVESANIEGNRLIVNLKKITQFPQLTIDLDADVVKIVKLTAKPDVTCPATDSVDSGKTRTVGIGVKNTGNNNAVFGLEVLCGSVVQQLASNKISLGATQSTTVTATLTGTAPISDTTLGCIATAYDINNINNKDTCSFNLNVKHTACEANTQTCSNDGKSLLTCKSGSYEAETCNLGCELTGDGAACKTTGSKEICTNGIDDNGDGLIDSADPICFGGSQCKPTNLLLFSIPSLRTSCLGVFKQIQYAVSIILTLISLIVIFQLSRKLFFKRKKSRTDISLAWLTTIIISGLIAWLLFNPVFFWWGVVVGIGIIIVRWFIR